MKSDLHDLKKLTLELMKNGSSKVQETNQNLIKKIYGSQENENEIHFEETPRAAILNTPKEEIEEYDDEEDHYLFAETIEAEEEILKLEKKEIEMIKKKIKKNKGKRKAAADELGISERTLYRKIKQFDL